MMWSSARRGVLASGGAAAASVCQLAGLQCKKPQIECTSLQSSIPQHFTGGDIPSSYKDHFAQAYDLQANKGGDAANVARRDAERAGDIEVRTTIARILMQRLGYREDELDIIGEDDVLRMQGVGSPFRLADIQPGHAVLDLGSGFGVDAFLAAEKAGPSGEVVGIDLSAEEVQRACTRAEERGLSGRCRFLKADMEELPLPDCSFDFVISNGGFCLVPDKKKAFREIFRTLKPGGSFAVSCTVLQGELPVLEAPKRWPPCMDVFLQGSSAVQLVESCGFQSVVVDDSDSAMDAWDLGETELMGISQALAPQGQCSHAQKAAERRAKERVEEYLTRDRQAGVHWGNPEFDHIQEFDMNKLCARVIIAAKKPP